MLGHQRLKALIEHCCGLVNATVHAHPQLRTLELHWVERQVRLPVIEIVRALRT